MRARYARTDPFDGEGSRLLGGRWSGVGTRICYTSTHRSLAILDYLVHIDVGRIPDDLVIASLDVRDELAIAEMSKLPEDWKAYPAPV